MSGEPTDSSIILSPSRPLFEIRATVSVRMRAASFFVIESVTKMRVSWGSLLWSTPVTWPMSRPPVRIGAPGLRPTTSAKAVL